MKIKSSEEQGDGHFYVESEVPSEPVWPHTKHEPSELLCVSFQSDTASAYQKPFCPFQGAHPISAVRNTAAVMIVVYDGPINPGRLETKFFLKQKDTEGQSLLRWDFSPVE